MSNRKKATFSLDQAVLAGVNAAVARGAAPSKNALVERALVRELIELRRLERQAQWRLAAQDPLFLKDLEEIESAFRSADAETAGRIV